MMNSQDFMNLENARFNKMPKFVKNAEMLLFSSKRLKIKHGLHGEKREVFAKEKKRKNRFRKGFALGRQSFVLTPGSAFLGTEVF